MRDSWKSFREDWILICAGFFILKFRKIIGFDEMATATKDGYRTIEEQANTVNPYNLTDQSTKR